MAAPFPIENRAHLPADEFEGLAIILSTQTSIKHALDWLLSLTPPCPPVDMVTQDEFCHDILAPLPYGPWLVYDST